MDYAALRSEVDNDPTGLGYAQHLPDAPGSVIVLLNGPTTTMVKSRFVNGRTIMAECADSSAILSGLKTMAGQDAQVGVAWSFLNSEAGIDAGNEKTQAMCDQFVSLGVWTQTQADQVKAMAVQSASRAEVLGLGTVTEEDLRTALEV